MSKFTVKHVDNICNTEEMYFADKVVFFKNRDQNRKDFFTFWVDGGGEGQSFTNGTIYVMNDNGKTVAVYHLNQHEEE
jgi:hypothetical protein